MVRSLAYLELRGGARNVNKKRRPLPLLLPRDLRIPAPTPPTANSSRPRPCPARARPCLSPRECRRLLDAPAVVDDSGTPPTLGSGRSSASSSIAPAASASWSRPPSATTTAPAASRSWPSWARAAKSRPSLCILRPVNDCKPGLTWPVFAPTALFSSRPRPVAARSYIKVSASDTAVVVDPLHVTALTTAREQGRTWLTCRNFAGHADPRTTLTYIRSRDLLSKSPAYVLKY